MAKVILTVKFFFIWLYNLAFVWVPSVMAQIGVDLNHNVFLIDFLVVMIFLPEIALLFIKDFRAWIKGGVEDGDGNLNKSDLKDLIALYMGLWCTRIFAYFSWQITNGVPIDTQVYLIPLAGALGGGSIPILRAQLSKRKK